MVQSLNTVPDDSALFPQDGKQWGKEHKGRAKELFR